MVTSRRLSPRASVDKRSAASLPNRRAEFDFNYGVPSKKTTFRRPLSRQREQTVLSPKISFFSL
jgi:hypothetical protein